MKLLSSSCLFLLTLGAAIAQEAPAADGPKKEGAPPAENQEEGKPRHGNRGNEDWKKADTDGDGFLSEAEFALMPRIANLPEDKRAAIFRRIDKDGDGKISPEEMRPNRPRPAFPPIEEFDANKDGKITFDEFQKIPFVERQPEERQRAMFDRMDRDKDGALTPKDGPPPGMGKPPFERKNFDPLNFIRQLDTNGDGSLSFEEFRKAGFVKDLGEDAQEAKFNEMDRNKDLKIDAADFPPPPDREHGPGGPPRGDGKDEKGPEPKGPPMEKKDS